MDDVAAFERRLTRTAELRTGTAASPELEEIFRRIALRRTSRSGGPGPAAADAAAPAPRLAAGGAGRLGRGGRARCPHHPRRAPRGLAVPGRAVRQGRRSGPPQRQLQHRFGAARALLGVLHRTDPGWPLESRRSSRCTRATTSSSPDRPRVGSCSTRRRACHLMVATVTGIAPLRSIVRDVLHRGIDAQFIVLHGASHADELPYFAELMAVASSDARVEYRPTVSRPEARAQRRLAARGRSGRRSRVPRGGGPRPAPHPRVRVRPSRDGEAGRRRARQCVLGVDGSVRLTRSRDPLYNGNGTVTVTVQLPKGLAMGVAVVRYTTKPDRADENEALIEKVFAELEAERPAGAPLRQLSSCRPRQLRAHRGDRYGRRFQPVDGDAGLRRLRARDRGSLRGAARRSRSDPRRRVPIPRRGAGDGA